MKRINKSTLDELIRLTRKYFETGDTDYLPARLEKASELSEQAFGNDHAWLKFSDLTSSIIGGRGSLKPDASNADIYTVFAVLGFAVAEDNPEQEVANES